MPAEEFARKFTEAIDGDTGVKMAYGRLNVDARATSSARR